MTADSLQNQTLSILILSDWVIDQADNLMQSVRSFESYSRHKVMTFMHIGDLPDDLDLSRFDAIVIHYTLYVLDPLYLSEKALNRLTEYKGLKIQFIQDEYRQVKKMWQMIRQLKIDVVFSIYNPEDQSVLYPPSELPQVHVASTLASYVPEQLVHRNVKPIAQREFNLTYRARRMGYHTGRLGYLKWALSDAIKEQAQQQGLKIDMSCADEDRLYGEKWIQLLTNSKATFGTLSCTGLIDFDGDVESKCRAYLEKNPSANFEQIYEDVLQNYDNKTDGILSPRCFEAAALRTAQVLLEGRYSGILQKGRHFIELKNNLSNLNEVFDQLRDEVYLQKMADITFEEIAKNPAYQWQGFVQSVFDLVVADEFSKRSKTPVKNPYSKSEWSRLKMSHDYSQRVRRWLNYHVVSKYVPEFLGQKKIRYYLYRLLG